MSRRKLLPVLVIPVVTVLLGALMSAPGTAGTDQPLPTPGQWPGGPICAEGALTGGEPTSASPPTTPLFISIQPCAGTDPAVTSQARWAVAQYLDLVGVVGIFGNPFAADGPTTATLSYRESDLAAGHLGRIRAACLVTGPNSRVACVRITAVDAAGTIAITPLPTDDPLVSRPATVVGFDNTVDPVCGACV